MAMNSPSCSHASDYKMEGVSTARRSSRTSRPSCRLRWNEKEAAPISATPRPMAKSKGKEVKTKKEVKNEPVEEEEAVLPSPVTVSAKRSAAIRRNSWMEELASDPDYSSSTGSDMESDSDEFEAVSEDDSDFEEIPTKNKKKSTPPKKGRKSTKATPPTTFHQSPGEVLKGQMEIEDPSSPFLYDEYPIYARTFISIKEAVAIIGGEKKVPVDLISCRIPQGFVGTGSFVVDTSAASYAAYDISIDGVGIWGKPSTQYTHFNFTTRNDGKKILARESGIVNAKNGDWTGIKITVSRYLKPANSRGSRYCKTIIKGFEQKGGKLVQLPFVVIYYCWRGEEGSLEDLQLDTTARLRVARNGIRHRMNTTRIEAPVQENIYRSFMEAWDEKKWPIYAEEMISFSDASRIILGELAVEEYAICTSLPQGFHSTGVFILDLEACPETNLRADGNGEYAKPQGEAWFFSRNAETRELDVVSKRRRPQEFDAQVFAKRYSQSDVTAIYKDTQFLRKIYVGREGGAKCRYAVVQYYWLGQEVLFEVGDGAKHAKKMKEAKASKGKTHPLRAVLDNFLASVKKETKDDYEAETQDENRPPIDHSSKRRSAMDEEDSPSKRIKVD